MCIFDQIDTAIGNPCLSESYQKVNCSENRVSFQGKQKKILMYLSNFYDKNFKNIYKVDNDGPLVTTKQDLDAFSSCVMGKS